MQTPVIINTYTTSGQIVLSANKTLDGQTLEAEQFSFQATEMDADGKTVENGYSETVKNADAAPSHSQSSHIRNPEPIITRSLK